MSWKNWFLAGFLLSDLYDTVRGVVNPYPVAVGIKFIEVVFVFWLLLES